MNAIEADGNRLNASINNGGIVIVDFYASWCGPCKQFAPIYEDASSNNTDITFLKIDTDVEQVVSAELQITSIPTIIVYRDSNIVFRKSGALSVQALSHLIASVRQLDMDEVRRELAG